MNVQPLEEEAIFHVAREIPSPEDRASYLAEACGDNQALRARVEGLLRVYAEEKSFAGMPSALLATIDHQPISEQPGTVIGPYKLMEQIGEGGFGLVFVAEQQRPVRRKVALKLIKPGMDTRDVIARFEAERQALALMDHPNIARVFDAGATDSGRPYFVMELVRGIPITDYCDQQQLTPRERLELFVSLCHAIQHAHQKGIIHRDVKPTNVLVTQHDGRPMVKVIDFGVAKALSQQLTQHTIYTQFAQMIGTPLYMSPEQTAMSTLDIDTRSDIYSLGVLLYELLTGSTPFDRERLREAAADEIRRIIREEEPPKPSTRLSHSGDRLPSIAAQRKTEPANLSNLVRGDLDWIVMKCLEKDRNRRYETANGLAMDIQRHLDDEPVEACPPSKTYRLRKFARKHRAAIASAIAFAVILAAATVVSSWQAIRAVKAERKEAGLRVTAERARTDAESQRGQAENARSAEAKLRQEAELREEESRRQAYASDISLAQQALAENRFGTARSLLNRHRPQMGQQDLRGWEWRYLWQNSQGDALYRLYQRDRVICSLAASSDGTLLAVGEAIESGASVWDLRSRREVAYLPAGDAEVYVAFSPTAPLLAFSSISGAPTTRLAKVQLWDAKQQSFVAEITLGARCCGLAFAADGGTLVTATAEPDQRISLWKVPKGAPLASFKKDLGGVGEAIPLAVTPDLKLAAYGSWNGYGPGYGKVHVFDLSTGDERWRATAAEEYVIALAFSPDGNTLATGAGYRESAIRLWDVANGKEIRRLEGHGGAIGSLLFSPDGKWLFSASADRTIRIWELSEPPKTASSRVLRGHDGAVWRFALLPDGQTLVSGSEDGAVNVWDTGSVEERRSDVVVPGDSTAWRFTPDGRSIVTLNAEGEVKRWRGPEFDQAESVFELDGEFDKHHAIISPDCHWLAIRRNDDTVEVWDLNRHAIHQRLPTKSELPWQFFADGTRLVVMEKGTNLMHVWEVTSGARLETWRRAILPDRDYQMGDISPDGRWCLTIGVDGKGIFRDVVRGRDVDSQLDAKRPYGVAFSPDSSLFAVTNGIGVAYTKVWDTAKRREVTRLGGGHSVAFSPDGKRLAFGGGGEKAVVVWDLETRCQLVALPGKGSIFFDVEFSPDGSVIGCRNSRGELYLWRAPSWDELQANDAAINSPSDRDNSSTP